MAAILPAIMVSESAGPSLPFSIKKLFFATPEKSPFEEGAPPEKRPTIMPRSMEAMISSRLLSPGAIIMLSLSFRPRSKPSLLAQ